MAYTIYVLTNIDIVVSLDGSLVSIMWSLNKMIFYGIGFWQTDFQSIDERMILDKRANFQKI